MRDPAQKIKQDKSLPARHANIDPPETESSVSFHRTDERLWGRSYTSQLHDQVNQNQQQTGIWQEIKQKSSRMLMDTISQNKNFALVYLQMNSFQQDRFRRWYSSILDSQALNQRQQRLAEDYFDQNIASADKKRKQKGCPKYLNAFRKCGCELWISLLLVIFGLFVALFLYFNSNFIPSQNLQRVPRQNITDIDMVDLIYNNSQDIRSIENSVKAIEQQLNNSQKLAIMFLVQGIVTFLLMAVILLLKILWTYFKNDKCCWSKDENEKQKKQGQKKEVIKVEKKKEKVIQMERKEQTEKMKQEQEQPAQIMVKENQAEQVESKKEQVALIKSEDQEEQMKKKEQNEQRKMDQ